MEFDCIEGAKMVEDSITSSLNNDNDPLAQNLAKMNIQDMCQIFIKVFKAVVVVWRRTRFILALSVISANFCPRE